MQMIAAPPHNFAGRYGNRYRVIGWDDCGNTVLVPASEEAPVSTFETIKADPGWYIITWDDAANEEEGDRPYWKEPIVAWRIEHVSSFDYSKDHTSVYPVACSGAEGSDYQGPDGLIYGDNYVGATLDEYIRSHASSRKQT